MMKLVRITKDVKIGSDLVKKGCLGVINGHATFHAAMVTQSPKGPVYEVADVPVPGDYLEEIEIPGDDILAQKAADHLRWSMDPADPWTNEISALLKEVVKGKPKAAEHLSERIIELT